MRVLRSGSWCFVSSHRQPQHKRTTQTANLLCGKIGVRLLEPHRISVRIPLTWE